MVWTFDQCDRTTRERKSITDSGSFTSQWEYNSADMVISMVNPGGNSGQAGENLRFAYHPQGALKYLYSETNNVYYVQNVSYDAAGRVDYRNLGATSLASYALLKSDYSYYAWTNQGGRLSDIESGLDGSTFTPTLQNMTYGYDQVGNITSIADNNASETLTFGYDALNRLDWAKIGGANWENYDYDSSTGNLWKKGPTTTENSYYYLDSSHKHAVTHLNGTDTSHQYYWYDSNGNMTTRKSGSNTYNLYYDEESHLDYVNKNSSLQVTYTYDGDGNRVKAVVEGTSNDTITVYIGGYYEYEITGSTTTTRAYYSAGGQKVALRTITGTDNKLYYLLTDHLGSTSVSYRSDGGQTVTQKYKPWGEVRPNGVNSLPTKYTYTGQYSEVDSFGLMYYLARWYDPVLGRFNQPDSIIPSRGEGSTPNGIGYVPQGNYSALVVDYHETQFLEQLNYENNSKLQNQKIQLPPVPKDSTAFDRYAYSLNNPVKYTDPSGHCIWDLCIVEISLADITILAIATFLTIEAIQPGRPEDLAQSLYNLGEQALNGINALFSKTDWVPPCMSKEQRDMWGKAAELYKKGLELPNGFQLPKELAQKLADLIKQDLTPEQAADALDELEDSKK